MMTLGHGDKLSRKQEQAISALLENPTLDAAAKVVGVGRNTLWRWTQDPDFKASFQEARARVLDSTVLRLQNASGEAVETLRRALGCGSPPAEIKAAEIILDKFLRVVETKVDSAGELQKMLAVTPVKMVLYEGEQEKPRLDLSRLSDQEFESFKTLAGKVVP